MVGRVTTRDVADFKSHLRRDLGQAVATVNRALVTLRRFFGWLVDQGQRCLPTPQSRLRNFKRQQLAPKGMERKDVRRLLREVELTARRASQCHLSVMFLYTGCRCGDVVDLELDALRLGERSGTFRFGKGEQGKVGSTSATGPSCPSSLPGNPTTGGKHQGLHR